MNEYAMVPTPRPTDSPGATAGPYLRMIDPSAANDSGDLEISHTPTPVLTASGTHSTSGRHCVGVFLAVGLAVAGYTDGLNSILSLGSFKSTHCTTHSSLSPISTVPSCLEINAHWFRLAFGLGSALGPLIGGFVLADRFDRKWTILAAAMTSVVGNAWAIAAPSQDLVQPIVARSVQGVGASLLAFAIPLLLVEVAATKSRGFFGAVLFFGYYIGVFAWVAIKNFDETSKLRHYWQGLYLIPLILSVVVGIGAVTFVPSDPRWLFTFRGASTLTDTNDAAGDTVAGMEQHGNRTSPSPSRRLLETYTLKRVAVAFVLLSVQQFFALANLAQLSDVFEDFRQGLSDDFNQMTTADMLATGFNSNNGFVAFVVAIPALTALCLVDKAGRRRLLLVGAVLAGGSQVGVTLFMDACSGETFQRKCDNGGSGAIFLTLVAIAVFGGTWGPVCVIYPFELFPTEVRARGTAVAFAASTVLVLLIREFYVELCFNPVALVVIPLFGVIVVALWCPETKRLALEDAEKMVAVRGLCSLS